MELKNRLKVLIIEKGYKSVLDFCTKNELNYRTVNRLANNESSSFHHDTIIEVCSALDCNINDLFYIEKEGA